MVDRRRQVAWTRAALDCLDEILATIAADAPGTATRVLGVFDSTAESLSDLATRGRIVPELEDSAIREVFVYPYRLIYQVSSDDVRVLAVIPGAMEPCARVVTVRRPSVCVTRVCTRSKRQLFLTQGE